MSLVRYGMKTTPIACDFVACALVFEYLKDVLDIQWITNQDKTYRGARVLVAFGGPNIWVNTQSSEVEGYWWLDKANALFTDNMGLNDYLEEIYNCS